MVWKKHHLNIITPIKETIHDNNHLWLSLLNKTTQMRTQAQTLLIQQHDSLWARMINLSGVIHSLLILLLQPVWLSFKYDLLNNCLTSIQLLVMSLQHRMRLSTRLHLTPSPNHHSCSAANNLRTMAVSYHCTLWYMDVLHDLRFKNISRWPQSNFCRIIMASLLVSPSRLNYFNFSSDPSAGSCRLNLSPLL